jgi:hypothetical protein
MTTFGGMPGRVYGYSAIFHVAVILLLYGLGRWHFFDRELAEETPIVVQIVNLAPQTRATQVNPTPPQPEKPPEVAQAEPPKPEPPKPEPPKAEPPPPPPPPPEAKPVPPEPKPEPPKPPEPKPELQAELPKPPPEKPHPTKTKDDTAFDTLLKNLAKRDPAREAPKQVATAEKASSQPIAPLGSSLTMSERDLVLRQLHDCWAEPVGAKDEQTLMAVIRIYMNPDATVRAAEIVDNNNQPFAESARRAALNPSCHQLKLPLDKYGGSNGWNVIEVTFRPTGVS